MPQQLQPVHLVCHLERLALALIFIDLECGEVPVDEALVVGPLDLSVVVGVYDVE